MSNDEGRPEAAHAQRPIDDTCAAGVFAFVRHPRWGLVNRPLANLLGDVEQAPDRIAGSPWAPREAA